MILNMKPRYSLLMIYQVVKLYRPISVDAQTVIRRHLDSSGRCLEKKRQIRGSISV